MRPSATRPSAMRPNAMRPNKHYKKNRKPGIQAKMDTKMDNMLLNNVKEAMDIIRRKEMFPGIMSQIFVSRVLEETYEERECRKLISRLARDIGSRETKKLFDQLYEIQTAEQLNDSIDVERSKNETAKHVSSKETNTLGRSTRQLIDVHNNFYMYMNNRSCTVVNYVYDTSHTYDIPDFVSASPYYLICRMKPNGIPYIVYIKNHDDYDDYNSIYDFEKPNDTLDLWTPEDDSDDSDKSLNTTTKHNIAYGSKYICTIDNSYITIYNHKKEFVKRIYSPPTGFLHDRYPTRIDNGFLSCFYKGAVYREIIYDTNYDAKKRIRTLIYYKHPEGPKTYKHVPKEIMLHIYSFLCI
jgi:hypothetical protein